jgi:hypothetical protein
MEVTDLTEEQLQSLVKTKEEIISRIFPEQQRNVYIYPKPPFEQFTEDDIELISEGLRRNTKLEELLIRDVYIGDQGTAKIVSSLENHPKLRKLELNNVQLGNEVN